MPRRLPLLTLLALSTFALSDSALARPDDGARADARPGLAPHSIGRAAKRAGVAHGRAATLPSVTRDRAATMPGISHGRAASLAPVTQGRAASLPSITRDRAASMKGATLGRAAGLAPVTTGRAAGLLPATRGRAASMASVGLGRAARMAPVTAGRAAALLPVSVGREEAWPAVSLGRAAQLPALAYTRHLETLSSGGSGPPLYAYWDGYLAPYGARGMATRGLFEEAYSETIETPVGSRHFERRVTGALEESGLGGFYWAGGSVYDVLDAIDPYGPHRYYRAPAGQNVPPGEVVGHFYFPAAYYVRPLSRGAFAYNRGYRLVIVPKDVTEEIAEDFDRTLRKSNFPLVIGDVAFKEGNYVQAALAFWEALDRKPDAVAPYFALSDALVALRNYGFAAELIRAGLARSPRWADRLDRRGVYGVPDDFGKHLAQVEEFAEANPRAPQAWFLLGYLRMTSGDPERRAAAAEAFRRVLDFAPDDDLARRYVRLLGE